MLDIKLNEAAELLDKVVDILSECYVGDYDVDEETMRIVFDLKRLRQDIDYQSGVIT